MGQLNILPSGARGSENTRCRGKRVRIRLARGVTANVWGEELGHMTSRDVASSEVGESGTRSTDGHAEQPMEGVCVWRNTGVLPIARLASDEGGTPSPRMVAEKATLQAINCPSDVTGRGGVAAIEKATKYPCASQKGGKRAGREFPPPFRLLSLSRLWKVTAGIPVLDCAVGQRRFCNPQPPRPADLNAVETAECLAFVASSELDGV